MSNLVKINKSQSMEETTGTLKQARFDKKNTCSCDCKILNHRNIKNKMLTEMGQNALERLVFTI